MLARLRRMTRDDRGASAVEYGLLVAAIAAVIIVAVFAFGGFVSEIFADTCTNLQSGLTANPGVGTDVDCPTQ
jgi:pilus assembly protein Flp/PilA